MKFGNLVDKPIAYFFARIDEELQLKETLVSFFYFDFSHLFYVSKNCFDTKLSKKVHLCDQNHVEDSENLIFIEF